MLQTLKEKIYDGSVKGRLLLTWMKLCATIKSCANQNTEASIKVYTKEDNHVKKVIENRRGIE